MVRGWTSRLNRSRMRSTRSCVFNDGSSPRACSMNPMTSGVSLWACRGPRLRGPGPHATRQERGLGLIKGRTGKAETHRGFADWVTVFLDTAQHLVLDLNHVASIEELIVGEEFIGNGLGARVETALLAEALELWVRGGFRHGVCKYNYAYRN